VVQQSVIGGEREDHERQRRRDYPFRRQLPLAELAPHHHHEHDDAEHRVHEPLRYS
jgi:hypothetical protein